MLLSIIHSVDHNEILHTSRQCNCRDVCKIPLWSVEHIINQSTPKFDRILNSIKIPFMGRAPDIRSSGETKESPAQQFRYLFLQIWWIKWIPFAGTMGVNYFHPLSSLIIHSTIYKVWYMCRKNLGYDLHHIYLLCYRQNKCIPKLDRGGINTAVNTESMAVCGMLQIDLWA